MVSLAVLISSSALGESVVHLVGFVEPYPLDFQALPAFFVGLGSALLAEEFMGVEFDFDDGVVVEFALLLFTGLLHSIL